MALRERHWALVQCSICILRFSYQLHSVMEICAPRCSSSYELVSGKEPNEGIFMSEFKVFLEKELALVTVAHSYEQLELLVK